MLGLNKNWPYGVLIFIVLTSSCVVVPLVEVYCEYVLGSISLVLLIKMLHTALFMWCFVKFFKKCTSEKYGKNNQKNIIP